MERIGLIQMTSSADVNENVTYIEQQTALLAKQGAQWVVTPENAVVLGNRADYHNSAEPLGDGPIQQRISRLALEEKVWILIGSMPIALGSDVMTTSVLFNPQGNMVAHYDKLHMFDVDVADTHQRYRESETFTCGNDVVVAETPFANIGLSICYDVRFPQLFSELRRQGAQIITVPAAFTAVTGKAHWEVLLRSRAIETQCWVIAVGQGGHHPCGRETWGHSMVISPWGEVVASLEQQAGSLLVEIELEQVESVRATMPIVEHSRFRNQFIEKKEQYMSITRIEEALLQPAGLTEQDIANTLSTIAQRQIDYADIYFQSSWHESLVLEDSIIKDGSFNIDRGVGVRAVTGEKTGFAYSDQIQLEALQQSAIAARGIAQAGKNGSVQAFKRNSNQTYYAAVNPLESWEKQKKTELLQQVDAYIRTKEPLIQEVSVSLSGVHEQILVAATDGTYAGDIRPLVRLSISVLAQRGDRRERGSAGGGGRFTYDYFLNEEDGQKIVFSYADEAIRQALVNLDADAAPAGTMPVVLGSGWPGVLLHEAVGHGLEGDFNRKDSSVFSGKIGQKVTSDLCTIVDDGTLKDLRGSLNVDDEGVNGQYNVLIENGILKGYMQDKLNARLMGVAPTGNGRRESYAHLPMPRMTNTYMLPGQHTPEEIISTVKKGVYAPNFGGGQVDITSGKFVFSASEAYLIENGKVTRPIKGATLIGSGIEAMQQVSMVGNDLSIDRGVGVCGKAGQSVPVGVGQPTLKLDALTVGGTE